MRLVVVPPIAATWILRVVALSLVGLQACGGDSLGAAPRTPPQVVVQEGETAIATRRMLSTGPRIAGTLEPRERSAIAAQVGGPVLGIYAELGDSVKRGQLLARIDPNGLADAVRSAQAEVTSAEQALKLAVQQARRSRRLVQAGALAEHQLELDQNARALARAQLDRARAQLARARHSLADTRVRSPMDGVVSVQSVYAGDIVAAGARLFDIIDPTSLRLEASVPATMLPKLQVGMFVDFEVHGWPDVALQGEIVRIAPAADPTSGQITLLVSIPNVDGRVLAGLFAEGRVTANTQYALTVPTTALDWTGTRPTVTAILDGKAARAEVETGIVDEVQHLVAVLSGLQAGVRVVLGPARDIEPGTPVRIEAGPSDDAPRVSAANRWQHAAPPTARRGSR